MLIRPMRRFPLRLKIAGFAAGLILLATALVAIFTVILPWRAKLKAQERIASLLVKTALPLGIDLRADGAHFDPARVHALVENSSRVQGVEIVYALLWDDKGHLDSAASSVNVALLRKASEQLAQLYVRDRAHALEYLAVGRRQPGIRRLPIKLAADSGHSADGSHSTIGRLDLGLSTMAIDSELRRSLIRDAFVLAGTLFFAVMSALSIARRIAQPLTDLSAAMGRVREGDFEITASPSTRTNDEIGDLARSFDEMAQGLKERERLRGTLGRYVSGDVAERILSEDDDLSLRGEVRHVAVAFLDVRGFTTISEKLTPTEVVALLNEYFDVVVDRVAAHGGTVNKFIGDAAMCIWGAPKHSARPERSAVLCALEIQARAKKLSAERTKRGLTTVGFGIGINAGEAVAGNLGAAKRLEYTVIGDAVNLAQRLESQARAGEVLVSQPVYDKVAPEVDAAPRDPVKLKGKSKPVPLWEIRRAKVVATEAA
jgi:class 3 adenylate cyclase/acid stress-induced BolA-like protein IbaG/YrbA